MNNIFDYAILSLFRYGAKNLLITIIFGILVFLMASVIFITTAIKHEYSEIIAQMPDILVQKNYGGKSYFIDESFIDEIYKFPSVKSAFPRLWGQYYFQKEKIYNEIFTKDKNITLYDRFFVQDDKAYFTIFGVLAYQKNFLKELDRVDFSGKNANFMLLSDRAMEFFQIYKNAFKFVPFFAKNGELIKLSPHILDHKNSLLNSDVIVTSEENARKILGIKDGLFSDICVEVANKKEIELTADKIRAINSDLVVITKDEISKKYEFLYDYKSGFFLMFLMILVITFVVILYDKLSGTSSEERREIGILRALGWDISHIIKLKIMENLTLSILAFFIAISLSIFYVFILQAPLLSDIFIGYKSIKPSFELPFVMDYKILSMIFLLSVPLYVAVSIIPCFKIATNNEMDTIK